MRRQLKLLRYVRPHWRQLLLVFAALALSALISLAAPWPIKVLVDNVLGDKPVPDILEALPGAATPRGLLPWVALGSLLIFLAGVAALTLSELISVRLGQRMTYTLGADIFLHLQRLSVLFHHRRPVGDTVARVTGDASCAQVMVMDALVPLVHSAVLMIAMFVIMWQLEPTLTLLSLCVVPFLALTIKLLAGPMRRRNRERRDLEGRMFNIVEQTLNAVPVVQAFTRERHEHRRFESHADDTLRAYQRATSVSMLFRLLTGLTTAAGTAVVLYVGALYALDGKITVGTIIVFVSYLASLYGPINSVTYTGSTLQYAFAQADRVLELMEAEPDVKDRPDARDVMLRGHVRYEDVSFGYGGPGPPVLKGIALEALPGEVVAIVGPTGAGKTTLVNLLVRFFDPWVGRVSIDGHDVRDLKLDSLRRQVAMVLQDPFIFPFSVADNIAYGRPDATREDIVAAAAAANADAFISGLPEGYDTVLGEKGATLSGGEKQRLAIARAFLKDAPILILDEPTSALDARTEAMLLEALERLMRGRVTFIIAHRLSTIRHADRILVLDQGRIVERGRHADLVRRGGLYASLYRQQMEVAEHDVSPDAERAGERLGRRISGRRRRTRWMG